MTLHPRKSPHSPSSHRRGNAAVAIIAAAAGLALVLGAVYMAAFRAEPPTVTDSTAPATTAPATTAADGAGPSQRSADALASGGSEAPERSTPSTEYSVLSTQKTDAPRSPLDTGVGHQHGQLQHDELAAAGVTEQVPSRNEPKTPATPAERVTAHLAAGEFGLATDVARAVQDARERSVLFREIADAAARIGEFDAAGAAVGRIPLPEIRREAARDRAERLTMAGGMADPTELINLITTETSGPWFPDDPNKTISFFTNGVMVDPHGRLAAISREDTERRLEALSRRARKADLNEDMARPSDLRIVSLTRLEREVARCLQDGHLVPKTMHHLAGLSQVKYVFVEPHTGEVLIGGPAEPWRYDEFGRPIGVESGRPMLHLDDLVTVLRVFTPSGDALFTCRIEPRQAGLIELKKVVDASNARGSLEAGAGVRRFAEQCREALGPQDARFSGVPADSRVAAVMLEADYKMKLIGLDRFDAGAKVPSYFDLLDAKTVRQNPPAMDALRWWLTMRYESVLHSPDHTAFEIQGASVRCQSEDELVTAAGQRIHTGQSSGANKAFAANFTQLYHELAAIEPVFADLQNIFDLALVAAIVQRERLLDPTTGYGVFGPKGDYSPAKHAVPVTVDTAVNHRVYGGRDIIVQVAGGVKADLMAVLRDSSIYRAADRLTGFNARSEAPADGRWWWDAE